jgi:MOSC domain-containing protein YiiM
MKIISVNVGLPREAVWKGITVRTGIFKEPVAGSVAIRKLNLAGDEQADLTVHGGSDKAVYAYPVEHYEYWRRQLPEFSFSWGAFGENLTTEGRRKTPYQLGIFSGPDLPFFRLRSPACPVTSLNSDSTGTTWLSASW